nr:hypothetical protein CFP56_67416 [Quercus suber]
MAHNGSVMCTSPPHRPSSWRVDAHFLLRRTRQCRRELRGRASVIDGLEFPAMGGGTGTGENGYGGGTW